MRILRELGAVYSVDPGSSRKTCAQMLFTRQIASYRDRALKKSEEKHGTRIGTENPMLKKETGVKHVMKEGCLVPLKVKPGKSDLMRMVYYVGHRKEGTDDTIEWEAVSLWHEVLHVGVHCCMQIYDYVVAC